MKACVIVALICLGFCANARTVMAGDVPATSGESQLKYKWLYWPTNLDKKECLNDTIVMMKRAKQLGLTGIVVSDNKFGKWKLQSRQYSQNVGDLRKACTDEGMQLIATICPIGYSADLLALDPNLAEGMPVRGATFVVKDGKLVPDDPVKLENDSLTQWKGDTPVGWFADEPGTVSFKDDTILYNGKATLRQEQAPRKGKGAARLFQTIKVQPWHYYHVSIMVKTQDCTSTDFRIHAHSGDAKGGLALNAQPMAVKPTMDWTRLDSTFNSTDNTEVGIYIGSYAPKGGTVWWSDAKIEAGGFVNVIRRASLPVTVTSEDGKTTFVEGKDYSEIKDPKLGNDPNPGYFKNWHDQPVVTLPSGTSLAEGQKVNVSYHFATTVGKDFQINCCMSEPKVYELIAEQVQWMKKTAQPDAYFMFHDEIRHGGWDDTCTARHMTCGQILADNISKCTKIVQAADPGKLIVTWNDMFDPFHNAHKGTMYMAKGADGWYGSWEGLSPQVTVMNWSGSVDSFKFFADRGNGQIISCCCDGDDFKKVSAYLAQASKVKGVIGVMYTTWTGDFSKLEEWAKLVSQQFAAKQ